MPIVATITTPPRATSAELNERARRSILRVLNAPELADTLTADALAEAITNIVTHEEAKLDAEDQETPDEAASTRLFLTGIIEDTDWQGFGHGGTELVMGGWAS